VSNSLWRITENIWVSGRNYNNNSHCLLHYDGETWEALINGPADLDYNPNEITGIIQGVYLDSESNMLFVLTHIGFYQCEYNDELICEDISDNHVWQSAMYSIEANAQNDIFFGGAYFDIWHYNGSGFHLYDGFPNSGRIRSLDVKDDFVVCAGGYYSSNQLFVIRGYRNSQ